jgi:hypothetical protein
LTKDDEFPLAGKFTDLRYGRYEVCGDVTSEIEMPRNVEGPSSQFTPQPRPWSITRPWTGPPTSLGPWQSGIGIQSSSSGSAAPNKRGGLPTSGTQLYEKFLKRSIPFVSLCLDQTNRNIVIDSIISNVYVKIADSSVSGQAVLSAVASKVACESIDLVILDAKFVEVSDDKGKKNNYNDVN